MKIAILLTLLISTIFAYNLKLIKGSDVKLIYDNTQDIIELNKTYNIKKYKCGQSIHILDRDGIVAITKDGKVFIDNNGNKAIITNDNGSVSVECDKSFFKRLFSLLNDYVVKTQEIIRAGTGHKGAGGNALEQNITIEGNKSIALIYRLNNIGSKETKLTLYLKNKKVADIKPIYKKSNNLEYVAFKIEPKYFKKADNYKIEVGVGKNKPLNKIAIEGVIIKKGE